MTSYEGYVLPRAILRSDLAGRDLAKCMMKLLSECDYSFTTTAEREIVHGMKERPSYIVLDFDMETKEASESDDREKTYKFSDCGMITGGNELFRYPELRLQPCFVEKEASRIHDTSCQSIIKCDVNVRRDFHHSKEQVVLAILAEKIHFSISEIRMVAPKLWRR